MREIFRKLHKLHHLRSITFLSSSVFISASQCINTTIVHNILAEIEKHQQYSIL